MNDIDIWQNALKEIDMNEAVQFVSRGKLIVEESQVEMYNKIQALLNCPELECSHRFLYSLDPEELTEAEVTKICNLYKLGQERGLLEPDDVETPADVDVNVDVTEKPVADVQPVQAKPTTPTSAYTILYSAMRNGNIATGEAYSNAVNPRSAKADAISQLEKAGYTNIAILAIECGDPDCSNTNSPLNAQKPNIDVVEPLDTPAIPDYAAEDDMLDNRPHNNHVSEDDVEEDDMLDGRKHNLHVDEAGKEEDADSKEASNKDNEDTASDDEEKDKDAGKEEQAKEPDEKLSDKDAEKKAAEEKPELDASKKAALKDSYKKAFKAAMLKCNFEDKKFEDLTLDEKVEFFTVLSDAWGNKEDPTLFMTDKELDQLEKIVIKK